MTACPYCLHLVRDIPHHYTVCKYIDNALGPVKPPKRKRNNQCAYKFGCESIKAYNSAYCRNHRNEVSNRSQNERLGNKRAGTR